jgi:cytidylate kinase
LANFLEPYESLELFEGGKMPLITITRSLGSGGAEIARCVAKKLDITLYDDEKLQKEAVKLGIRSNDLKSLDEKAPGLFDRIWTNKPELYLNLLESVVYEVSKAGRGVIIGHGSQFLLGEFGCALHVFIYASEACRIHILKERHDVTPEVAEKVIRKNDINQQGMWRYAFHREWNDLSLYDLIINTEKLGTDQAANLIIDTARSQVIQECTMTALDAMERLSVTKRIEAALLRAGFSLSFLHIDVPKKGIAYMRGLVEAGVEPDRLVEVVKKVPGVADVEIEIGYRPMTGI